MYILTAFSLFCLHTEINNGLCVKNNKFYVMHRTLILNMNHMNLLDQIYYLGMFENIHPVLLICDLLEHFLNIV